MHTHGFELLEKLTGDPLGELWKAQQTSLGRTVAVMALSPELTSDPHAANEAIREAQAAAKLKHPNLVQIYDIGEEDGGYFYVFEFVEGPTVAQILEEQGNIQPKRLLSIAESVAQALDHAWTGANLTHRDIRPHHILIDSDETVKLANLGIVKASDSQLLAAQLNTGRLYAVPNYLSPEQAKCTTHPDCRSDMYSLGATLYHMATGKAPFGDLSPHDVLRAHASEPTPNPRDVLPSVPLPLAQLIARLMKKSPEERYASWREAIPEIRKAAVGRIVITKRTAGATAGKASRARRRATASSLPPALPLWARGLAWAAILAWWFFLARLLIWPTVRTDGDTTPEATPRAIGQPDVPPAHPVGTGNRKGQPPALAQFKRAVARDLVKEAFEDAMVRFDTELPSQLSTYVEGEIAGTKQLVLQAARMNGLLQSAFQEKLGQKVSVVTGRNGRQHTMIVQRVVGGTVTADAESRDGGRKAVTFSVARLPPLERRRWLGSANTQAKCVMHFILSMQAGDFKSARSIASSCGPFADVFAEMAESESTG